MTSLKLRATLFFLIHRHPSTSIDTFTPKFPRRANLNRVLNHGLAARFGKAARTSAKSGQDDAQPLPAAHGRGRRQLRRVVVDAPCGPAIEDLVQRNTAFQAGEVGAQAVMDALAEGDVR